MRIEDPTPQGPLDPSAQDSQVRPDSATPRWADSATPSWADESTVAIPLTELFADDTRE